MNALAERRPNLVGTLSITSGLIRTATSGARIELDSDGTSLYATDNAGSFGVAETVDWWRDGQGDSHPFAAIHGYWASSGTARQDLVLSTIRTVDSTHSSQVYRQVIDAAGTGIVAEDHLQAPKDDGSTRDHLWYVAGKYGDIAIGTTDGISGSPEFNPGFGWCRTYLSGSVRLPDTGIIYANGFTVTFSSIGSNSTSSTSVTYATQWSSNLPIPDVFLSPEDAVTSRRFAYQASSRDRSGCTVSVDNFSASTASMTYAGVPMAT